MGEEIDYKKLYEQEQKKVSVLEQRVRLYELPGDMRGFYSMQKILNQQADFLNEFDLNKEIKLYSKDDKLYDRASDLWEKMPANISKLTALKSDLNITGSEDKDIKSRGIPLIEQFAEKRN